MRGLVSNCTPAWSAIHRDAQGEAGDQAKMLWMRGHSSNRPPALSAIHRAAEGEAGDQTKMVRAAGLEPARLAAGDFKSPVSTISPRPRA